MLRAFGNKLGHTIFEVAAVGEIETLVDANRQDLRNGGDGMTVNISEVLRSGDIADDRHMRPAGPVEMESQRKQDAKHDARLNAQEEGADDGHPHRRKVGLGVYPDPADNREIDK